MVYFIEKMGNLLNKHEKQVPQLFFRNIGYQSQYMVTELEPYTKHLYQGLKFHRDRIFSPIYPGSL